MRPSLRVLPLALVVCAGLACGESRQDKLAREAAYANAGKKDDVTSPTPEIPADPTREALRPLLTEIYGNKERLPDVVAADLSNEDGLPYQVTAGVLSVVRVKKGLSNEDKVKAIILGTAEADSWTFRKNARRDYADLIQKIKYSYGDETKEKLLRIYADLKLVAFFNSPDSAKVIAGLPAEVKGAVEAMQAEYVEQRDKFWQKWMGVKMYARRTVAGDEPFRGVLRQISRDLG